MKSFSKKQDARQRRARVIARLQAQLEKGTKPEKGLYILTLASTGGEELPLTPSDINRIKRELEILEGRI